MIVLPISFLLSTAGLIWISRKGHIRIQWSIALFGAGSAWIATFVLLRRIPETLNFSLWKPEHIFPTTFLLNLDGISWPLAMGIISLLLLIILTRPSREQRYDSREVIGIIVFTCLGILSVMAKNVLTIVTIWMLMDGAIFSLYIHTATENLDKARILLWSKKNLASTLLLLVAYSLSIVNNGNAPFESDEISGSVFMLIIVSCVLRLPFLSLETETTRVGWMDSGSAILLDLFPAITGLAALAHLHSFGIPEGIQWSIRFVGVLFLVTTAIKAALVKKDETFILSYLMGFLGIGLIAETFSVFQPGLLVIATSVLCILIIPSLKFVKYYEKWSLFFPIAIALMLIGIPGSPGMIMTRTIVDILFSGKQIIFGLVIVISVVFFTVSLLRSTITQRNNWKPSDNLTRMSYISGLILFILSGIGIGIALNKDFTFYDIVYFLILAIVVGGVFLGVRHLGLKEVGFTPLKPLAIPDHPMYGENLFLAVHGIVRGSGKLFENETGMLWTFVILLLVILAFVNLGL